MIQIPAKGRDDVSGSNFRSVFRGGEFLDFGYRNTTARVGNHLEHALNGKVIWEALTYRSRHYSKSQIFVQKFNFHEFLPKFFLTIFLVKSKLSKAKMTKTTTF